MVDHAKDWDYMESFLWGNNYPVCNGVKQSPINIDTNDMKECRTLCNILPKLKPSKCFVGYKNKTVTIKYSPGSYTEYESTLYELSEISIHTPSLHSIDGQKFDIEVCLVHKLTDNSSDKAGLILCCLFERGPHYGEPESFISQIINGIPSEEIDYEKEISVSDDWSASWLLPENSGYFSYFGSLPFPPCSEGYSVFVYEKVGIIGNINIETFKRYLGNNSRPVKSIGSRTVFYTPYLKSNANSERKIYYSKNKYLKCYPERAPTVKKEPVATSNTDDITSGISSDLKNTINNIIMSLIILLIIVNAFYFVKFLFRHFYIQKMLRMFGGKDNIKNDTIKMWRNCQGTVLTPQDKAALKKAAKNAENATKASGDMSGLTSQGMSPRSIPGFQKMTSPIGASQSQYYQTGSQGSTYDGYSRQASRGMRNMRGSTTYPSSRSRYPITSTYPGYR